MAVNKDRVRLLVDALRSGKYTQGQEVLTSVMEDGSEFDCCMGVGCKVAVDADVIPEPTGTYVRAYGFEDYLNDDSLSTFWFPEEVRRWYGFSHNDPTVTYNGCTYSFSYMNDAMGLSFEEIADVLEENFLGDNE